MTDKGPLDAALLSDLSDDDVLYDYPVAQSGEPMDPVLFVRWDTIAARLDAAQVPDKAGEGLDVERLAVALQNVLGSERPKTGTAEVVARHYAALAPTTAPATEQSGEREGLPLHLLGVAAEQSSEGSAVSPVPVIILDFDFEGGDAIVVTEEGRIDVVPLNDLRVIDPDVMERFWRDFGS